MRKNREKLYFAIACEKIPAMSELWNMKTGHMFFQNR